MPPRQISRQLTDRIIFNATDQEPSPEEEPLRRQSSRTENRQRYRNNQQEAARNLFYKYSCCICFAILLVLIWALISIYLYFWGWIVLYFHHGTPCDQPLATWLTVQLIWDLGPRQCFEALGNPRLRMLFKVVPLLLIIVGAVLFFHTETCSTTNPELYTFVKYYLVFLTISYTTGFLISCVLIGLIVYGMMHGWFDQTNGASPETIKKIETVTYDPSMFAQDGRVDDDRPSCECCCCQETFGPDKAIKKTSCQHFFHEECLEKWLKVATTCPICRHDLDLEMADYPDPETGRTA